MFSDSPNNNNQDRKDEKYPNWKQAVKLSVLLIITHLLAGLVIGVIWGLLAAGEPPLWFLASGSMVANLIVIRYALSRTEFSLQKYFGRKISTLSSYLVTIILIFGASIVISQIINISRLAFSADLYQQIIDSMLAENIFALIIVLVILPAVLEELIFRGIIFSGLLRNSGFKFALLFSSALFGLIHFNFVQGISAFLTGLILGWLYWRYNSLIIPIIAHGFNNLLSIIFNRYIFIPGYSFTSRVNFQPVGFMLLGFILLGLGIYFAHKNSRLIN